MKSIPTPVIRLWMPAIFFAGLYLFLRGLSPWYWVICIPVLPLLGFMNTLAEIRREDKQIRIRQWWGSIAVDESEIVEISPSALQGISRLRVRHPMPPWGIIYFVADWSDIGDLHDPDIAIRAEQSVNRRSRVADVASAALLGTSGFVLGRMIAGDFHNLMIAGTRLSVLAMTISIILAALFVFSRKRHGTLANILLFVATLTAALIRV